MLLSHWNKTRQNHSATLESAGTKVTQEISPDGSVHITMTRAGDRVQAIAAFKKLQAACLKIKPDPKNGGTAAIRALRDGL